MKKKVIIMGAAGRDFHNFNVYYRNNPNYEVVAFTATQIPDIDGRKYPAELCGSNYPKGIPIYAEEQLPLLLHQLLEEQVPVRSFTNGKPMLAEVMLPLAGQQPLLIRHLR